MLTRFSQRAEKLRRILLYAGKEITAIIFSGSAFKELAVNYFALSTHRRDGSLAPLFALLAQLKGF